MLRSLLAASCLLFAASGAWFVVAFRPTEVLLRQEAHRADSLQARKDTLYRELRVYIGASALREEMVIRLAGELNQARAY